MQTCLLSLSLSFFHPAKNKTQRNKEGKVEREGEVKEREREMDMQRERKQDRMENVRFDVIVCMSGFAICSWFDWQKGRAGVVF